MGTKCQTFKNITTSKKKVHIQHKKINEEEIKERKEAPAVHGIYRLIYFFDRRL